MADNFVTLLCGLAHFGLITQRIYHDFVFWEKVVRKLTSYFVENILPEIMTYNFKRSLEATMPCTKSDVTIPHANINGSIISALGSSVHLRNHGTVHSASHDCNGTV